jgi:hypothetical protein
MVMALRAEWAAQLGKNGQSPHSSRGIGCC